MLCVGLQPKQGVMLARPQEGLTPGGPVCVFLPLADFGLRKEYLRVVFERFYDKYHLNSVA